MTINNLMTGDLVVCNNGKMATVMKNTTIGDILRFHTTKDSFSYLNRRYNDDLTHTTHPNLTIDKVYRVDPDRIEPSKIGDLIANPDKMLELGKVIYDRGVVTPARTAMAAVETVDTDNIKPTINDLMTGDMLVHRNGKVSTVYKDTPFGDIVRYATEKNSFTYLYRFDDEELTHESKDDYDIIGVFRTRDIDESTAGDAINNPKKMILPKNAVWTEDSDGFTIDYFHNSESCMMRYPNTSDIEGDYDDFDDEDF